MSYSQTSSTAFSPFKKKKLDLGIDNINQNVGVGTNTSAKVTPTTSYPQVPQITPKYDYSQAKSNDAPAIKPATDPFAKKETPTASQSYLDAITKIANESKKFYNDTAASDEALVNKYYDRKNNAAIGEASTAQEGFNQYKDTVNADAEDSRRQAETQWGSDQRALMQTRRESEGRLRNKFAGQNTSDSAGAGSALEANTNLETEFNRQTNQGVENKQSKLFQIDQKAKSDINAEALKLKDNLLKIQNTVFDNEDQRAAAVKKAYDNAKAGILEIESNLANLKYQNASTAGAGLSENFLKTGVPTTVAEFEFLQKNKDAFANMGTKNGNNNKALDMVNAILKNSGAISGGIQTGNIPIINQLTGNGDTAAKWEGLKNLLTLAGRGQLKGSGQVSDFETKMLEKAALAGLDPTKQTEAQFKAGLEQLRNDLMSGGAVSTQSVVLISPNGQAYTVDPSEVQTALQNGWRQQ